MCRHDRNARSDWQFAADGALRRCAACGVADAHALWPDAPGDRGAAGLCIRCAVVAEALCLTTEHPPARRRP